MTDLVWPGDSKRVSATWMPMTAAAAPRLLLMLTLFHLRTLVLDNRRVKRAWWVKFGPWEEVRFDVQKGR